MQTLTKVAQKIESRGGRAFLVGGSVRDEFFGKESKDFDVEVFGLSAEELVEVLSEFGTPDFVGRSFGVFKMSVGGEDFDFSLPQRRTKVTAGHQGESVEVDENMTLAEAQARRDFTMNALSKDVLTGEVFDFHGGLADIRARVLRATSEQFSWDPLRVRRGAQFCARFDLTATAETVSMARDLRSEADTLSTDRVWGEWEKLAALGVRPSLGLRFLAECGWLPVELSRLADCPQDSEWHPEGTVWEHTLQGVDRVPFVAERDGLSREERVELFFGVLLHDVGKPDTTEFSDGHLRSWWHDEVGATMAMEFMVRVGAPRALADRVCALVRHHMWQGPASPKAVRRLSRRVSSVAMLARVMECDMMARGSASTVDPLVHRMVEVAEAEQCVSRPVVAMLMGRHLLAMGFQPGPQMGAMLRAAFEAQVEGEFSDLAAAQEWVRERF